MLIFSRLIFSLKKLLFKGFFLFIFYVLLNEEVRKSIREKKKKLRLENKRNHKDSISKHSISSSRDNINQIGGKKSENVSPGSYRKQCEIDEEMMIYENKFAMISATKVCRFKKCYYCEIFEILIF
jgi:hypothetical protein